VFLVLGMHRGVLLSTDIRSTRLPWAPLYPARSIQSPALSDPLWQFAPWLSFARRELAAGRLPLWNPHQDGGVPLLGNFISSLLSPLVWPALALGLGAGWNASLLARVLLAALSAFLFLRELGRSRTGSALGAVAFSLSGAFIAWLEHPQTLAVAPVPLLLLAVRRGVRAPTGAASARAAAGIAIATFLVLAGGHPETALMAALAAVGVLVATGRTHPHPIRSRAAAIGGAIAGAALAGPALLPSLEYFGLSVAREGEGRSNFVLPLRDLARFVMPRVEGSNVIEAAAAVSLPLLLLVPIGLAAAGRRGDRAVRLSGATGLLIVLAVYASPLSRLLARATPVYWTRLLLLLPLALAVPASLGLDKVRLRLERRAGPAAARLAAVGLVLLAAAELLARASGVHGVTPPERLAEMTPLLERLRAEPGPFRVLPLHTILPPNSATDYAIDDVRGYDALAPRGWRRLRSAIGRFHDLSTQRDAIEPWDLAPGGAALDDWNVAYLIVPPEYAFAPDVWKAKSGLDVREIYAGRDGRILKNLRVKPRVYLEGPGSTVIEERVPGRWRISVHSESDTGLRVADPFFPGWRSEVDGKSVALAARPGEPMRVVVPAGDHEVLLVYRPRSFRAGLVLAAIAGASLAGLALVRVRHVPE